MLFIDANIFLEIIFADNKMKDCEEFLHKVRNDKINIFTSDYILCTCLMPIEKKSHLPDNLRKFMLILDNLNELEIMVPSPDAIYTAFEIMEKYKLDFDDALVVGTMKSLGIEKLVSFDKDFDKVKEIERVEPKNAF